MRPTGQSATDLPAGIGLIIGECLLSAVIVVGPLAFGAVEPWATAVLQALILLLGVVVIFHCARSGVIPTTGVAALASFVAFIGFLQTMNVSHASGVRGGLIFSTSGLYSFRLAFMWGCFAVLGASASVVLSRPAARVRFAWVVFLIGVLIAFVGIVQHAQGNTYYYGLRPVRNGIPFGPYTNYNHAASLMAAALCMGMGLICAPLAEKRAPLADRIPIQVLIFAIMGLIFFGILKTGSRAGLAALGVGSGAFVWGAALWGRLRINSANKWFFALVGGVVVLGLLFNPGGYRFAVSAIAHGAAFRVEIYKTCLWALSDFPAFGIGLGAIPAALHPYQTVWVGRLLESAHSDVLDAFLQVGIVGAAVILAFLVKLAAQSFAGCRMDRPGLTLLRIGSLAACAMFLAHGFVESNIRIPANAALVISLLAYASSINGIAISTVRPMPSILGSYSLVAMAILLLIMLAVPLRSARGAWFFYRAAEQSGENAIELLQRAVQCDARPEYQYALAVEYMHAADRTSNGRQFLAQALDTSAAALESFPFHQAYRSLHASILTKLGRGRDASAFPI